MEERISEDTTPPMATATENTPRDSSRKTVPASPQLSASTGQQTRESVLELSESPGIIRSSAQPGTITSSDSSIISLLEAAAAIPLPDSETLSDNEQTLPLSQSPPGSTTKLCKNVFVSLPNENRSSRLKKKPLVRQNTHLTLRKKSGSISKLLIQEAVTPLLNIKKTSCDIRVPTFQTPPVSNFEKSSSIVQQAAKESHGQVKDMTFETELIVIDEDSLDTMIVTEKIMNTAIESQDQIKSPEVSFVDLVKLPLLDKAAANTTALRELKDTFTPLISGQIVGPSRANISCKQDELQMTAQKRALKRKMLSEIDDAATKMEENNEQITFTSLSLLPILPCIESTLKSGIITEPVNKVRLVPLQSDLQSESQLNNKNAKPDPVAITLEQRSEVPMEIIEENKSQSELTMQSNAESCTSTYISPPSEQQLKMQSQISPKETSKKLMQPLAQPEGNGREIQYLGDTLPINLCTPPPVPSPLELRHLLNNASPISMISDENDEIVSIFYGAQKESPIDKSAQDGGSFFVRTRPTLPTTKEFDNPLSSLETKKPLMTKKEEKDEKSDSSAFEMPQNAETQTDEILLKNIETQTILSNIVNLESERNKTSDVSVQTYALCRCTIQITACISIDSSSSHDLNEQDSPENISSSTSETTLRENPTLEPFREEVINISSSSSSPSRKSEISTTLKKKTNKSLLNYGEFESTVSSSSSSCSCTTSSSSSSENLNIQLVPPLSSSLPSSKLRVMDKALLTEPSNSQEGGKTKIPTMSQDKLKNSTKSQDNLQPHVSTSDELLEIADHLTQSLKSINSQSRRRNRRFLSKSPTQAKTPSKLMRNSTGTTINSYHSSQYVQTYQQPGLSDEANRLKTRLTREFDPRNLQPSASDTARQPLMSSQDGFESQGFSIGYSQPTNRRACLAVPESVTKQTEMPPLFRLRRLRKRSYSPLPESLMLSSEKFRKFRQTNDFQVNEATENISTQSRPLRTIPPLVPITVKSRGSDNNDIQPTRTKQPYLTRELIQQFLASVPASAPNDTNIIPPGDQPKSLPGGPTGHCPTFVRTFLQNLPDPLPPPPLASPMFFDDENTLNSLQDEFTKLTLPRDLEERVEIPGPFSLAPLQHDITGETTEEDGDNRKQHFHYSREDVESFRSRRFLQPGNMRALTHIGRQYIEALRLYVLLIKFVILYLAFISVCGFFGSIFAALILDFFNGRNM